ncbi:MAG: ATPase, T2SS/T4P/T4SS family [Bacilli bacterium]|jgi:pilus assembly protein CpaF
MVTDISFNGKDIFYQHNLLGRRKSDIRISITEVMYFLRQIANLGEKQFSYSEPILDMSFDCYRLNAVHYSLGRYHNEKSVTFSIRIASVKPRISLNGSFMPNAIAYFLESLVLAQQSIVIGGQTGSGKTELQKYLLSRIRKCSRVIIIDNVQELTFTDFAENLDITNWQVNHHLAQGTFQELIRNALRNNPDWLIVAESRGKEMIDVLNAAMTGHPVITTIHAKKAEAIPQRMARMILMNGDDTKYEDALNDIYEHFRYFIYVRRAIDDQGHILRFVESFFEYDSKTKEMHSIYELNKGVENYNRPTYETAQIIKEGPHGLTLLEVFKG